MGGPWVSLGRMFLSNTPTQAPLGPPTTTNLRFPTPAGSVELGSLRSPLLHLPRKGWEGAVRELTTGSFLHWPREFGLL